MDFDSSSNDAEDEQHINDNKHGKRKEMQELNTEQDENTQRREHRNITEWQLSKDYGDEDGDLFNLQRLAMEHHKSPFPDFQFDILDEEGGTDDNAGSENDPEAGPRKKQPTRMDSWEDNWLFQKKKCNSRSGTADRSTLMSMKMYGTIDEQKMQGGDDDENDVSDSSDYSGCCKSKKVQRVERPCVMTSSSSSDAEESDDSESSASPTRKSPSIESEEKIPIFESHPSTSESSGKSTVPKLLVDHSYSVRSVNGTKSCTSEDSSCDEFEKKAAIYKSRRRASWCPLETPAMSKKKGKRRQPLLPLGAEEDEPESEIKPMDSGDEALVGFERQMLHRDTHHSSFRAKKASPNFVLNPLYVPDEGGHNPRDHNPFDEPNAMQLLEPAKSESGYSSCSPDSMINLNNIPLLQPDIKLHEGIRQDAFNPSQQRIQSDQSVAPAYPDSSFLW